VWSFGFHVNETRRFSEGTLCADDQPISIIGTAHGHVIALWTSNFVAREICRREKFYLCDHYGLVACGDSIRRRIFELIGCYEESIRRRMEDPSVVEIWSTRIVDKQLKRRVGAEE